MARSGLGDLKRVMLAKGDALERLADRLRGLRDECASTEEAMYDMARQYDAAACAYYDAKEKYGDEQA